MKPWEFVITCPEDLPVLADLLEDWEHPGVKTLRWMIETGRWPAKNRNPKGEAAYCWSVFKRGGNPSRDFPSFLDGVFPNIHNRVTYHFYTLNEAIWVVINAGRGVSPKKSDKN